MKTRIRLFSGDEQSFKLVARFFRVRSLLLAGTAWLFAPPATGAETIFVAPGDTLSLPTPIANATVDGAPGGDSITSMQLVVIGDPSVVTNPAPSETLSLAPGEEKTFTPSFVVGNVTDGTYTVTLHMVTPDDGIVPDPDSADSDTTVSFAIASPDCSTRTA